MAYVSQTQRAEETQWNLWYITDVSFFVQHAKRIPGIQYKLARDVRSVVSVRRKLIVDVLSLIQTWRAVVAPGFAAQLHFQNPWTETRTTQFDTFRNQTC